MKLGYSRNSALLTSAQEAEMSHNSCWHSESISLTSLYYTMHDSLLTALTTGPSASPHDTMLKNKPPEVNFCRTICSYVLTMERELSVFLDER